MFRPALRRLVYTFHVGASVAWLGSVLAYLALDVTVAISGDPVMLRAAYVAMARVTWWSIVPLAFASLVSGIVLALGTAWGLFRHYWVVISLVLTTVAVGILLVETRTIDAYAAAAADPATDNGGLRALGHTLLHSIGGVAVLSTVLVLNVYKPRGLTRHGQRRRREGERAVRFSAAGTSAPRRRRGAA